MEMYDIKNMNKDNKDNKAHAISLYRFEYPVKVVEM